MNDITQQIQELHHKDQVTAYHAYLNLVEESKQSNLVYPYMEEFLAMLNASSSYVRMRGLGLLAHNAKWDDQQLIEKNQDVIFVHISDEKPSVVRQFIKLLPIIIERKMHLLPSIKEQLLSINLR